MLIGDPGDLEDRSYPFGYGLDADAEQWFMTGVWLGDEIILRWRCCLSSLLERRI